MFDMEAMPVSRFKATCLSVLQRVSRSGRPILLTRFGKPLAEIVPPRKAATRQGWIGSMKGRAVAADDLTKPALPPEAWAALRD
jgi:antitoxin (DNA-binding transcriptional repressor) of toxin-antitoxin stability system